ncbi:unnamed protein product [Ophioblennius macclurei]
MSSENASGNVSAPLRNLINSVQCVRDRVRDGESNESDGAFNLSNFWLTLNQAAKAVSQEATKLSLAFSKTPVPSQQEAEKLSDSAMKSVLTLSTVYYWLPKSQGLCLRRQIRDATVGVLEEVVRLLETVLSSPLHTLSQEQLTSTGGVWAACDHFLHLPQDNKTAAMAALSAQLAVVKDAIEELEQALFEAQDPFRDDGGGDDDNDDDDDNGEDASWSEKDRRVAAPCLGLMKAAAACARKLTAAVRANGNVGTPQSVAQIDDLTAAIAQISPGVDDLALCLYPPVDYSGVETNVSKLAALLKKVLGIVRSSHVCGESELTWIQFLDGAIDHNLQKARDLIQEDS